jgi:amino acid adenylation domain-containing protein
MNEHSLVSRPTKIRLSYAQQRLWFLDQLQGGSAEYNLPQVFRLRGLLNRWALQKAVNALVERHESLRTHFAVEDGIPYQVVESIAPVSLESHDWRHCDRTTRDEKVAAAITDEWFTPFNLLTGPVLRSSLLQLADTEWIFIVTIHHIAADAWSNSIVNAELAQLYEAYDRDIVPALPILRRQYADFAIEQRGLDENVRMRPGLEYWTKQLAGLQQPQSLPLDRVRPLKKSPKAAVVARSVPSTVVQRVKELGKRHNATPFMTLLAAFAILLFRYTDREDLAVTSPIVNRKRVDLEQLVGFFVNTIVLRFRIARCMSFEALLAEVRKTSLAAYRFHDVPFDRVVEALGQPRVLNSAPLSQVAFAFQNTPRTAMSLSGLDVEPAVGDDQTVRSDLEVHGYEDAEGFTFRYLYNPTLFDRERVEQLATHFNDVISAIVNNTAITIDQIALTAPSRPPSVLKAATGDSPVEFAPATLPEMFEHQALRTPDAVAVVCGTESISYMALNQRANQLSSELRDRGVGVGDVVGLALTRSNQAILAILAVMKCGAAYLPLDPSYPTERLSFMVGQTKPKLIISNVAERISALALTRLVVDLDVLLTSASKQAASGPSWLCRRPAAVRKQHCAYIIYTSGSTGRPKGVIVSNSGIEHLINSQVIAFDVGPTSRLLQFASLSFDAAFSEFAVSLSSGATLVMLTESDRELDRLPASILRHQVSHAKLPPTVAGMLDDMALAQLEMLICGGEMCTPDLVKRRAPSRRIINAYGPTESTVCATMTDLLDGEDRVTPIGRPVPGTCVLVLDRGIGEAPTGVDGEIYITGEGLADGYFDAPALTAARFVANPHGVPGTRMYRTGDMGRVRWDGQVECRGRNDSQVKLRGHRVELTEVAAVLKQDHRVHDALVVLKGEREQARMIAYVVVDDAAEIHPARLESGAGRACNAIARELRQHLQLSLPAYLVPARIIAIDSLPTTPNGKLDQDALSELDVQSITPAEGRLLTPTEAVIADAFAVVLNAERVDATDDFFALGGHSLLAAHLVTRLANALQRGISIRLLFEAPTPELLAARLVANDSTDAPPFVPAIVLRAQGSLPPFFCLPPGGGLGWVYGGLLRSFESARPVCCLQARTLCDGSPFPATVEEAADEFMDTIRSQQPVGPYHLIGWSFGGLVAHQIACRLQSVGERVDLLAVLDAYPDAQYGRLTATRIQQVGDYYASLKRNPPPGLNLDHIARMQQLTTASFSAAQRSTPRYYEGDMLLAVAKGNMNRRMSWRPFVSGSITAFEMQCHHDQMLDPGNIEQVGRFLNTAFLARQSVMAPSSLQ